MPKQADYLLVLDLETTGTDEHEDRILEIGCVLARPGELVAIDEMSVVIHLDADGWDRLQDNEYVRTMHTDSGLLAEALESSDNVAYAEWRVLEWLKSHRIDAHEAMLSGSGVSHFDRRFLKVWMPNLEKYLLYPNMDFGVVRRFLVEICGLEGDVARLGEGKEHRALPDARQHLAEGVAYRQIVRMGIEP